MTKKVDNLIIALAQLNLIVGDVAANASRIIEAANKAKDHLKADMIVFHELAIVNYSPEDLLYHQDLYQAVEIALHRIADQTQGIDVVVGYPKVIGKASAMLGGGNRFNSAVWLRDGKILADYHKQCLPNYAVFDEKRYFCPDNNTVVVEIKGFKVGILICEDLWHPQPIFKAKKAGAELIVSPNASPFSVEKPKKRLDTLQKRVSETGIPIVYVNQIGGHDGLLFDGGSMVVDSQGECCCLLPFANEAVEAVSFSRESQRYSVKVTPKPLPPVLSREAMMYEALLLGVRDYVQKNGFERVLLGLSGGIDSALTLAIAVDALGKDNVTAVFMPSIYTSQLSYDGVASQAKCLGVNCQTLPINKLFNLFLTELKPIFAGLDSDETEENLQSRIRGVLLMALANKKHELVLTAGNKSELAVGYATLYGDMAGGFCVLKDVYKTVVYQLAAYRNSICQVIPDMIIERSPSAELAPDQKDVDSLPPYDILDKVLICYIEENKSIDEIVSMGFDIDLVTKIVQLIRRNEYKRCQSPPGTRITPKAFGRDWRYPMTARYLD